MINNKEGVKDNLLDVRFIVDDKLEVDKTNTTENSKVIREQQENIEVISEQEENI